MEVRICKSEDIISLLLCAQDDKDCTMFENWPQYQKWLIDAIYHPKWGVIVVDDGFGIVGFLVWELFQAFYKWTGELHYIYVNPDFRKGEAADKLVTEFIHKIYNSPAQRLRFGSFVLPERWVEAITLNVPYKKSEVYHLERTDEMKEWYNVHFRREQI